MEEVAQQQITRLIAGPNATRVTFEDQQIERDKELISPQELLIRIRRSPLTFRDITKNRYLIIDTWLQRDGMSVVVKARAI